MTRHVVAKRFKLAGIEINTVMKDRLIADDDAVGEASYRTGEIYLQKVMDGVPLISQRQEQAFCHELTHWILHQMNHKLASDEVFVDNFGSYLHQFLTTAEYDE